MLVAVVKLTLDWYHNIPVELRPPTLKDLKSASGVFISSTSRWVMPIHEVCLGDLLLFQNDEDSDDEEERSESIDTNMNKSKRNGKSYFYGNCKITEDIRRWVLEDVESRSTPLFETKKYMVLESLIITNHTKVEKEST